MGDCKLRFTTPKRLQGRDKRIWEESKIESGEVDIWKGCPDFPPSQEIIQALSDVSTNGNEEIHQYTNGCGHPRFINVLSKIYSTLTHQELNPVSEFLVSVGVYGAVYSVVFGNIISGDEVIIVEPFSDFYGTIVEMAGGVPVFVPLRLKSNLDNPKCSDWALDLNELKNAFSSKTKMIIIDTPNVHLGKVYTKIELQEISELCEKWNALCVAIEADEFLVHESEEPFTRLAMLPNMQRRTVTIGSSETTLFLKGWKVAWVYGASQVMKNCRISHLNSVFVCTTVLQEALAVVMENELQRSKKPSDFFKSSTNGLDVKKGIMLNILSSSGLKPIHPASGIFIVADWTNLESRIKADLGTTFDDFDFVKWFHEISGIQTVPLSMFFSDPHAAIANKMVRFCYNKKHETLLKAKDLFEAFATKFK